MTNQQNHKERGFTLIELLIVMSIIIIIATFAIPNITRIRRQGNETSAINSVQTIVKAQLQYSSMYPQNGFACSLSALGGDSNGTPGPQAAGLIPVDLATGHKAGYVFALVNCSKITVNNQDQYTSYEVTAVPEAVGKSGDRGFCSDDAGQIKSDPKGGTACVNSIQ
jgi:type IV pilus assembly protein PilA